MSYIFAKAFAAYPSQPPMLPETIRHAIETINATKRVHIRSWEELSVTGKAIIDTILSEIDNSSVLLTDLTGLNPNVLFETGYAIAKGKHIWPTLDSSRPPTDFTEFRLLTTIGYQGYTNSTDIARAYMQSAPHESSSAPLLESLMQAVNPGHPTLLYLKSNHDSDASVRITKQLADNPIQVVTDDPKEAPYQTLAWYAQQAYLADAVVCHLAAPERSGAKLRNARHALVAGMGYAWGKNILLLCEGDNLSPLDYRDLAIHYQTATAAERSAERWLTPHRERWQQARKEKQSRSTSIRLSVELKGLDLGEYIAENEGDRLVDGYFVETSQYHEALSGSHTIFVGRKGSGKSATFLQLGAKLRQDARSVLSIVKPVAYELEGILALLQQCAGKERKVYVIEALWKFLLYSDIACALREKLGSKTPAALTQTERSFLAFSDDNRSVIDGDFSSRLEACIRNLDQRGLLSEKSSTEFRHSISETLHTTVLSELRAQILGALPRGAKVSILVDNLDKAWDRQSDLHTLAEFLLAAR